jgi:hypothetical protein
MRWRKKPSSTNEGGKKPPHAMTLEISPRYCRRRSYFVTQCPHTSAYTSEHEAPASILAPSTVAPMITYRFQQAPWP